jgi:hypothetical protein
VANWRSSDRGTVWCFRAVVMSLPIVVTYGCDDYNVLAERTLSLFNLANLRLPARVQDGPGGLWFGLGGYASLLSALPATLRQT